MSDSEEPNPPAKGEFLVYSAEDGRTKIEVRLENETVWLTQQHMADLFQTTKQNVSLHLQNIFAERELDRAATVKESLTVQREGRPHAGKLSHEMAKELAEAEFGKFHRKQIEQAGGDFAKAIKQLPSPPKAKNRGKK